MDFGVATVVSITVIAFLAGLIVKATKFNNDKFIPIVCGLVGGAFGILGFYTGLADFPANDVITALAVGISSGLAATGVHQGIKQFVKGE
jgi:hypothetical protein